MQNYFRVRIHSLPLASDEIVSAIAFEYGSTGSSEALRFAQPDLTYDPHILHAQVHDLDIYFTEKPETAFFDKLKEALPHLSFEVHEEESKDWLAEWKKGFVPFKLVGPFWVVPSWCEAPPEAKKIIRIDPGMAFGTGTHATTKMAAYFVDKLCAQLPEPQNKSLIDVGTGTAILAIMGKMHGIGKVVGVEIDPEARRVAFENIYLNELDIDITEKQIDEITEKFDVVVANIIDGVLVKIKAHLKKVLKPGGDLFLTGILSERDELFFSQFIENEPFEIVQRLEKDEWVGYWVKSK